MKHIPLANGRGFAIVDDEDFEYLSKYKWVYNRGYARTSLPYVNGRQPKIYLHQMIMKAPKGWDVDHKNLDRLDNRRENLRVCSRSQNQMNVGKRLQKSGRQTASQYKGVTFAQGKWMARVKTPEGRKSIGLFFTELEAAKAYDEAVKKYYGEFAYFNFPDGGGLSLQ